MRLADVEAHTRTMVRSIIFSSRKGICRGKVNGLTGRHRASAEGGGRGWWRDWCGWSGADVWEPSTYGCFVAPTKFFSFDNKPRG